MFPGNRGCTAYMNRDPGVKNTLDALVSMAEDIDHELLGIAGSCNMPNCLYNCAVNSTFGTTLPGPGTRGGTFRGSSTCGSTLISRDYTARGGSLFPPGTATHGHSAVPSFVNPHALGFANAESRRNVVGGTMTRDWSRADEGRYGRTERGETRRGPMETARGRGHGRGTGRGFC